MYTMLQGFNEVLHVQNNVAVSASLTYLLFYTIFARSRSRALPLVSGSSEGECRIVPL